MANNVPNPQPRGSGSTQQEWDIGKGRDQRDEKASTTVDATDAMMTMVPAWTAGTEATEEQMRMLTLRCWMD